MIWGLVSLPRGHWKVHSMLFAPYTLETGSNKEKEMYISSIESQKGTIAVQSQWW